MNNHNNVIHYFFTGLLAVLLSTCGNESPTATTLEKPYHCDDFKTPTTPETKLVLQCYKDWSNPNSDDLTYEKAGLRLIKVLDSLLSEPTIKPADRAFTHYYKGRYFLNNWEDSLAIKSYENAVAQNELQDTVPARFQARLYKTLTTKYAPDKKQAASAKGLFWLSKCGKASEETWYNKEVAGLNNAVAEMYLATGDYPSAVSRLEPLFRKYRGKESIKPYDYAAFIWTYAMSLINIGREEDAIKALAVGKNVLPAFGDDKSLWEGDLLARLYQAEYFAASRLADGKRAKVAIDRSYSLFVEKNADFSDEVDKANALINKGHYAVEYGSLTAGLNYFERAKSIYHEIGDFGGLGTMHENMAAYYLRKRDWDKATRSFLASEGWYHGISAAPAYRKALDPVELRDPLISHTELTFKMHVKDPLAVPLDSVKNMVARVDSINNQLQSTLRQEGSQLANIRKIRAFYEKLIDFGQQQYTATEDVKYLQLAANGIANSKARILRERRQRKRKTGGEADGYGNPRVYYWQQKKDALKDQYRRSIEDAEQSSLLTELHAAQDTIEYLLDQEYQKLEPVPMSSQGSDVATISAAMAEDELLLDYFVGEQAVYVSVISKASIQLHKLDLSKAVLTKDVLVLRDAIANYPGNDSATLEERLLHRRANDSLYTAKGHELYTTLLQPLLPQSKSASPSRLTIVPDDVLGYVPFDALLTRPAASHKPAYDQLHFLVQDYTINYALSSAAPLGYPRVKYSGPLEGLFIQAQQDNPVTIQLVERQDSIKFDRLTYGTQERKAFETHLRSPALNTTNWPERCNSTCRPRYGIMHFSGHGVVFPDDIYQSFLLLDAGENGPVKTVSIPELESRNLETDLLILSACATGTGSLSSGEGVISMSRAAMIGGARSVVASYWFVGQRFKADLFADFYTNLATGQSRDEALANAKRKVIKDGATPYDWAAFYHTGDPSMLDSDYFR